MRLRRMPASAPLSMLYVAAVAILFAASPALAIELGDPAPEIGVAEWLRGEPITIAEGKDKNVYVLEFWATTCPYSRDAIPRLTSLQQKYADKSVVLIGMLAEQPEQAKAFVDGMGEKIGYRVAIDGQLRTAAAYMGGFRLDTIPYAFLIDKSGRVVWHGHPMIGLEQAIEAVLDGKYDLAARERTEEARKLMPQYFRLASTPHKAEEAAELGEKILEQGRDAAWLMNVFAWRIASKPGLITRDLDLAMRAAQAAYDGCGGKNAGVADTYARILFGLGKKQEAVRFQQEAVSLAEGDELRDALKSRLEMYSLTVAPESQPATTSEAVGPPAATEGATTQLGEEHPSGDEQEKASEQEGTADKD